MPSQVKVKVGELELSATVIAAGSAAARQAPGEGVRLLLTGDRDYLVALDGPPAAAVAAALRAAVGKPVLVKFPSRSAVRRRLERASGLDAPTASVTDLRQYEPLYLLADGTFSASQKPEEGMAAGDALVRAARWISSRRTSTFERLFPPSAFHPDDPLRPERLSTAQADRLLQQLRGALAAAAVGSPEAGRDADRAAQVRSAAVTVLSHLVATALKDPSFRAASDAAAAEILRVIDAEQSHPTARPQLRAHAITLLQLRAPALRPADRDRAQKLVRGLLRAAPPYADLKGPWRFAMCSAFEFYRGEQKILASKYGFKEVATPPDAPRAPAYGSYKVFEAPFKNTNNESVFVFSRSANPTDENLEMGMAYFQGILINRHAQLGSFDMRASTVKVHQVGYKMMMNSQCAGLTTRFALSRMFPDADIYSSWDSTYFNTGSDGEVTRSEGVDCFVAVLEGMARGESHAQIEERIRKAQWSYNHEQARAVKNFVQFVGPANPLVVARFADVNQDGKADLYDGFFDFTLREIAEDLRAAATPRDPGVAASQVGGEAAKGLGWAAGSLNRVTQYSDIWAGLPGAAELLYPYRGGGFYSHKEPPADVDIGKGGPALGPIDPGRLPAVCRYTRTADVPGGLDGEVLYHSWLAHSPKELKRLLCAAEVFWRAVDTGVLPSEGPLKTLAGQRGAVLLTLAGLLEFPADQNNLDGLWSQALARLNFPDISRSTVRACITDEDHDASNYYGSRRGLTQLLGDGKTPGALEKADPVAYKKITGDDRTIGRPLPLDFAPRVA